MPYYDTPMSKLEAVNMSLRAIGQTPVASLNDPWPDVQTASELIDDLTRQLQITAWNWNTEEFELTPDINGYLMLPANCVELDTVGKDFYRNVAIRGDKLYDKDNNTDVFTSGMKLSFILTLPFDDIPAAAKEYVACMAAAQLQEDMVGEDSKTRILKERAFVAMTTLRRNDNNASDHNTLRDNWSSYSILNRGSFRRRVN